jgi:hypothetical protein
MKPAPSGTCSLCLKTRELRESHFLPKALYRLILARGNRNPHPVRLTSKGREQTAFQATHHLLCADCETRFDQNGENWVMKHCYRGRGVFRLRSILEATAALEASANFQVYSASSAPTVNVEQLAYFCTSVLWRAAVRDWCIENRKYEAISLGERYQEQIRRYLLGEGGFPVNAALCVVLSRLKNPHLTFSFPDTIRVESGYCHRLHIPGIDFLMTIGKRLDEERLTCIVHSPIHPVCVCNEGDARGQREVLKLMGKVAPAGFEYPLVEGFESRLRSGQSASVATTHLTGNGAK